jgi:hypothetical protein
MMRRMLLGIKARTEERGAAVKVPTAGCPDTNTATSVTGESVTSCTSAYDQWLVGAHVASAATAS